MNYPLIPMSQIRPEIREIAVAYHENATNWIGDKYKLASDIQNLVDRETAELREALEEIVKKSNYIGVREPSFKEIHSIAKQALTPKP